LSSQVTDATSGGEKKLLAEKVKGEEKEERPSPEAADVRRTDEKSGGKEGMRTRGKKEK